MFGGRQFSAAPDPRDNRRRSPRPQVVATYQGHWPAVPPRPLASRSGAAMRGAAFAGPACVSRLSRLAADGSRLARPLAGRAARPPRWRAGPRVTLLSIGRASSKDAAFDAGVAEYARRLGGGLALDAAWVRPAGAAEAVLGAARRGAAVFLLDGRGKAPASSVQFADEVFRALEDGGSRVVFVVGDADGLPKDLVQHAMQPGGGKPRLRMMSFGPLTFTHRMMRLLVAEQVYRASEIRKGSGYHK